MFPVTVKGRKKIAGEGNDRISLSRKKKVRGDVNAMCIALLRIKRRKGGWGVIIEE